MANKLRLFVDADVLFAGSASPSEHSASLVVLRMAEITLIDAVASQQVIAEVERNLAIYLPSQIPAFRLIVSRCLRIVPDPHFEEIAAHERLANPKDLPLLVAALREGCEWLVTFNLRHYQPGHTNLRVAQPGTFVREVRGLLAHTRKGG